MKRYFGDQRAQPQTIQQVQKLSDLGFSSESSESSESSKSFNETETTKVVDINQDAGNGLIVINVDPAQNDRVEINVGTKKLIIKYL